MPGDLGQAARSAVIARILPRRRPVYLLPPSFPREVREELPVELAAFEGILDPAVLDAAARRAKRLGVGGDEVLRCAGILTPLQIAVGIAAKLGIAVDPLGKPDQPPALEAACAGVLLRHHNHRPSVTIAARGTGIRWVAERIAEDPGARHGLRIAPPEELAAHIREVAGETLVSKAVDGLKKKFPDFSAAREGFVPLHALAIFACLTATTAACFHTGAALVAAEYLLALCFLSWTFLRILSCLVPRRKELQVEIHERHLPIYTLIVPLHREAAVAAKLVEAMRKIRYPREKLEIKLVLEEDDAETRAVVDTLKLHAPFEVLTMPRTGPRTKPKALAAALPFARGSFVTVYDAEDEPEPDQLYKALSAFAVGPRNLACVQAKLAADNVNDSWYSRHFAAEYAGQFEVLLPALARLGLPLPLGGTSNHFRTAVLREVGGWDPYNVTEDADLGIRLARLGYRTDTIESTTWEEAPVTARQWLRQRTRWMKGWAQTFIVHMRHPLRLWRDLGTAGFFAFQILVGGAVLSALVYPMFIVLIIHHAITGELFAFGEDTEHSTRKSLALFVLGMGYFGAILYGLVGLVRRGIPGIARVLPAIPLYWVLLSAASWRALYQLMFDRYRWEKTEHGLARSSLRGRRRATKDAPAMRPVRDFVASRPKPRRL